MISEKEHKIIDEIARKKGLTQRELSKRTDLSLGYVNLILKRLATRGIVKTKNLNPKKIEYMLTPQGFSEKTKKSYNYILKTVDLVKTVRGEIAKIVLDEFNKGQKKFVVLGDDDLADIIELALKGFTYIKVNDVRDIKDKEALVLIGKGRRATNGFRSINIAEKLGEVYWGLD